MYFLMHDIGAELYDKDGRVIMQLAFKLDNLWRIFEKQK